jgi:hypothetical protein
LPTRFLKRARLLNFATAQKKQKKFKTRQEQKVKGVKEQEENNRKTKEGLRPSLHKRGSTASEACVSYRLIGTALL